MPEAHCEADATTLLRLPVQDPLGGANIWTPNAGFLGPRFEIDPGT